MAGKKAVAPLTRFWGNVVRTEGCWVYTVTGLNGYGMFVPEGRGSKRQYAHRFSWELHYGPIPEGMFVCHRCDNPKCIRPTHLFLGTAKDNAIDARTKGRLRSLFNKGIRSPRRLPDETVVAIRAALAAGETGAVVARRWNLGETTISRIRRGTHGTPAA